MSVASSRREQQDQLGKRILVGVGVVVFALLTIKVIVDLQTPELIENLCPKEGPAKEYVILVDRTDPFSETQRQFVTQWILNLARNLNQYERLSLYGLSADESSWNAKPRFSQCSPGNQANELYQTKSKIRAAYQKHFEDPLKAQLPEVMTNTLSPTSPIIEMIESIARRPELSGRVPNRRFIIVSDMMQNSGGYSQYKVSIDYDAFDKSPFAKAHDVRLEGATVTILYLEREQLQTYQKSPHIIFWQHWFFDRGSRIQEIVSIR
jgi:hypothetical protein